MSFLKNTGKALGDIIPGLGLLTFDDNLGKIFVTSGTGVVGYRVAMSLLEQGQKDVRVGVYKGEREVGNGSAAAGNNDFVDNICKVLEAKGAEIVAFDWTKDESQEMALQGVKTIFCSLPHMDTSIDTFTRFLQKCKHHKVEHFVKLSFLHNEEYRHQVPFCKFHFQCDDLLEQAPKTSRISYTILATSHLMTTPLLTQGDGLTKDHKYVTASYGMGIDYVSPNDVADAAMVVLLNLKAHRNKVYNLTAKAPITDREVAKILSEVYRTNIQHVELGYHDYVAHLKKQRIPSWLSKDSAAFEKMKASGIDENGHNYYKDLEMIIGRKPESFKDYLMNERSQRPGKTFAPKPSDYETVAAGKKPVEAQ
ncbi:NmrA family protein [Nitzschia inconspicua]|uniref:NmrA family protein n=1 Tax=Nitzschia inconspicua TaxID=303405 RepID=A0A9K3K5A7_9STRA|nr:NmrA family protein [Nitzschia inconspicua]KAG7336656.1 NmrA family protein [Nitzschia inconspicua]KAG7371640.1 NmrA family protein [Nitzschia inconspicua]